MFLAVTEVLDGFLSTLYNILVGVSVLLMRYFMTLYNKYTHYNHPVLAKQMLGMHVCFPL